jgi:hypothetical protein
MYHDFSIRGRPAARATGAGDLEMDVDAIDVNVRTQ